MCFGPCCCYCFLGHGKVSNFTYVSMVTGLGVGSGTTLEKLNTKFIFYTLLTLTCEGYRSHLVILLVCLSCLITNLCIASTPSVYTSELHP